MYFLGALTLFLATAQASITADVLATKLTWFGKQAMFLQSPALVITPWDAVLIDHKLGGAYIVIQGLTGVAGNATKFAETLRAPPTFSGKDAENIYRAYTGFVGDHVKLLNILTDSAKRFNTPSPALGKAMYVTLADIQGITGALGGFLKVAVPSMAPQFATQEGELIPALGNCLNSWNWVCGECCQGKTHDNQGRKCS